MKYKTGLVIGRFQPFHRGHLHLIKHAFEYADKLIIGVGSVNAVDDNNPFSYEERKDFIINSLKRHNLLDKIEKIVPINDYPSDDDWLKEVEKQVGSFEITFGNNEWTNNILEKAGYMVVRIPFHKREIYEGMKIREEMKKAKDPHEVLKKHLP